MSLSTMSWAEGVVDPNRKPTRRSANTYVPPHLRPDGGGVGGFNGSNGRGGSGLYGYNNNNNNNNGYGGGYRAPGRAGPGRGGFGVGRSRGWIPPPSPNPNPNPNPRSFYPNPNARPFNPNPIPGRDVDVSRKLRQLRVSGEDDVSGGGERDGDGDGDNVGGGTINFEAYEDIPVEASGSDVPAPAASFAEIDLGERLNGNIRRCRYARPTPVQRHAIPIAVAGRDLMACAQTGSGKTAAFCFPIISGVLKNRGSSSTEFDGRDGWTVFPLALVLSPTRELASQIYEEAEKFAYQTGVKIAVVYGGAPMGQQLQNMERGVDILVATPGRLVDLIDRSRVSLAMIKYLALDEADRMLDMGFEPQIRKIVQQMDMPPPGKRQTLLFSATFPSEIQRLAADFLLNYIFLTVGRVGSSTDLIAQKVEFVADKEKAKRLISLLNDQRNGTHGKLALTLVFVETKKGADSLERWLSRNGFPAIAIHGDKVQMERERALRSFKCGSTPILVATDVASRGLDIPHVAHVINFDFPKSIDDYVHRIGRTGRAGKSGLATAFFGEKNQPHAQALVELMKESKQEVPSWLVEYAKESSSYGGDQSQRYGSSKFGGYDFRRSENHYGSGSYGYGDSSMGVAATTGSYAAGSYGYSGHGDSSADAPAASFNDGAGSYGYSGQYEDSSAHASAASDTLPTSGGSDFAGTVHSFSSENYKNIVASGWD